MQLLQPPADLPPHPAFPPSRGSRCGGEDIPCAVFHLLARAYQAAGKLRLALPLFEATLKLKKAKLGPEHPDTLISMDNLALAYQAAGKLDLALPLYEETLKLMKAKLGPEHPPTLKLMGNLASAYDEVKQFEEAMNEGTLAAFTRDPFCPTGPSSVGELPGLSSR